MHKLLILALFFAATGWSYMVPPDVVLDDGRILFTSTRPLDSFPWKGERPVLSEHPFEGTSDSRDVEAIWEIREQRLYLIAVKGYRFGALAPLRAQGLKDLMPDRVSEGRGFADWFTGELVLVEIERSEPAIEVAPTTEPKVKPSIRRVSVKHGQITGTL